MICCKLNCDMSGPEWAFRALTRSHHIAHGAVFDKLGLKYVGQPVLLLVLSDMQRSGRQCTQKELAEILRLSPSTVTISIKSLEKHGYVQKHSDETDLRRKLVEITPLGADTAEKCRRGLDDIDRAMYSGFSPEELKLASDMFRRMSENLAGLSSKEQPEGRTKNA